MSATIEHVCIKCGLTDPEGEMTALCKLGHDDFILAWAHPRCLVKYRMVAAPFEMTSIQLMMVDRKRAKK